MSLVRLSGKAAVVTGGGSGIGRSVCEVFAREGCSVAVLDLNQDGIDETIKLMTSNHGNIHCGIKADISSSDQAKLAFKTAEEKLGKKITVLVNCAGVGSPSQFLDEMDEKFFDDVIRVNLKGTFIMSKEFLLALEKSQYDEKGAKGCIINVASMAGIRGLAEHSNYCSSKFGVVGMTKTIALEYAKHKVRCNAVLPGATETPILGHIKKENLDMLLQVTPMKRFAKPVEVANCILFLASEESSYVNGAALEVSGGYAA